MLTIDVAGLGSLRLRYLLLDLNGTVAADGSLLVGVSEALAPLRDVLEVAIVTADTHGAAAGIAAELGVGLTVIGPGAESEAKQALVESLGSEAVVFVGNGANDQLALREAAVGVAVIGPEGAAGVAVQAADVVVTGIECALGLLAAPTRLAATLRR